MAPRTRSAATTGKKVVVVDTVVTTTQKIVKETVQKVVVSPSVKEAGDTSRDVGSTLEINVSHESVVKENEKVEVINHNNDDCFPSASNSPSTVPPVKKVVVIVEDKLTPDNKDQQGEKDVGNDETQPADEVIMTPSPTTPKYQNPARKFLMEDEEEIRGNKKRKRKKNKKKKKKKKGGGNNGEAKYERYVYRVMKQVHPEMGISSKAMTVINNLMSDMFERIADEASKLGKYVGRATLSSVEIRDAVKLVVPGDLEKHAIAEASKAVTNYAASFNSKR